MSYTVKELASLANISVRTLHHYDEVDLLKPAYHAVNGYRMYEEEQLLLLQQILFFKELGFELKKIREIVSATSFNKLKALSAHKTALLSSIRRYKSLVKTIDKTIMHIKGEIHMKDQEIYQGFSEEKQKEYEGYIVDNYGDSAKKWIEESKKRTSKFTKEDFAMIKQEFEDIHLALTRAIKDRLSEDADLVQILVKRHYQLVSRFYDPTKELYLGLAEVYTEHPDFKKMFDDFDPRLAGFLKAAIKVFAEKNL
ncbi:MAG: HTH-type transcriptional activator mta [Chlamydiia bacterium]|nr:HTH-type transcriptional activator mta [Chlamydiia bacterium]